MKSEKKERIKVFLCDDHTLFRKGIRKLLEFESDIEVVGEADSGPKMLDVLKQVKPDVILMDIGMPVMDGVTATVKARKLLPAVNVIVLTVYEDELYIFDAIKAGAKGYLLKDASIEELLEAVRRVYKGQALIQPVIASKVLKEFVMLDKRKMRGVDRTLHGLTAREQEILRLLALGGTNKEIANKLGIAEKTVKNHIGNIFQILHVNNRTQAALYAIGSKLHLPAK